MRISGPRTRRVLGAAALGLASAASVAAPAGAQVMPPQTAAPCFAGQTPRTGQTHAADTPDVSAAQARAVARALAAVPTSRARLRAADATPQVIAVHVHALRDGRRGDRWIGPKVAQRQIDIMNNAYAGMEAPSTIPSNAVAAADVPFRFKMVTYDNTRNASWYHANPGSQAERQMKRSLHEAGSAQLNLYFTNPTMRGLFGWSTFPWRYASQPRLDGVVVSVNTLPGGRYTDYNLGDTAVHESGHWLGLFHTFQGGCASSPTDGDQVADTPPEQKPSYYCQERRDTCKQPGRDPIHNFMDYSYDSCMFEFTPDQAQKMQASWSRWRAVTG